MKTSDFQFRVPERLIPLSPPGLRGERREDAHTAVLHRERAGIEHSRFHRLGSYRRAGDAPVVNDALMAHDQLRGRAAAYFVRLPGGRV
jgi:S-adenosylmethionine:tRNA-ribosyltransferase-isomerase (queuine synthetase)